MNEIICYVVTKYSNGTVPKVPSYYICMYVPNNHFASRLCVQPITIRHNPSRLTDAPQL